MTAIRGGLYFADLPDIGRKRVLVVSSNAVNERVHPVIVMLTSTERERSLSTYVCIDPPEGGVTMPTFILCHNIATVEANLLAPEPIGTVSTTTMQRVDAALAVTLGLSP